MTRKTWSTVDVSAYLDGELEPDVQVAFETTVSQDPDLRHRVAEMYQVVALIRASPLLEPPRNYLLTPAMVSEAKPGTQRRRFPLLMMRIATSVAAVAFVVASGLTLIQRGITPAMMTQSRGAPEAAMMLEKESAGDEMEMLAAPVAQAVPAEEPAESEAPAAPEVEKVVEREVELAEAVVPEAPPLPTPSAQGTLNIEDLSVADDEQAPALELGIGGDGEVPTPEVGMGMGGGVEESEPEADADSAEETAEVTDAVDGGIPDTTATPPEEAMPAEAEAAPAEVAATEPMDEQEEALAAEEQMPPAEAAGEMITGDDSEAAIRAMPQEDRAPEIAREALEAPEAAPRGADAAPAIWTPIGLGIVTAALAAITFWVSRRQLD